MGRRSLVALGVLLGAIAGWLLLRERPARWAGPAKNEPVAETRAARDPVPAESGSEPAPASRPGPGRIVPTALVESAPAPVAAESESEGPPRVGRVVGPDDAPVPGAQVQLEYGRLDGLARTARRTLTRTSDEGGWFSFPATDLCEARASKDGVGVATLNWIALGPMVDVLTIQLQQVRRLTIRFETEDGSAPPVDLSFGVRGDYSFSFVGKADEKGVGVVPAFPALESAEIGGGNEGWWVPTEPGKLRRTFRVAPTGDVETVVPLRRRPPPPAPGTVEGIVVDASGNPVPGANVNSEAPVRYPGDATTDADGRFRLTGIRAVTNCRVGAARGRGPKAWSQPFALGSGATVTGITIVIGTRPDVIVDVVDPDGHRAAGVTVILEEDGAGSAVGRATAVTGSDGRAVFDQAPWVIVYVRVDQASLPEGVGPDQDDRYRLILAGPREEPFVVHLRREVVLRGTAVGEDGAPIEGGTIRFWTRDRPPPRGALPGPPPGALPAGLSPRALPGPTLDRAVNVDSRGEFTFRVRSRWDYVVRDLRRLVRPPGGDPKQEIYDPVKEEKLLPDKPNVVVMKRRED